MGDTPQAPRHITMACSGGPLWPLFQADRAVRRYKCDVSLTKCPKCDSITHNKAIISRSQWVKELALSCAKGALENALLLRL